MCESLIGKNISHFHLTEVLGQGGMGCVYKALDEKMDRIVAVKVIGHKFGVFSAREGKALGQLNHANIVNVFHMDESDEGVFIVMEYVDGKTLRSYKNTSIAEALSFLRQSLLALEHAHAAGVIHRDIKPGNIMVTQQGKIKVMDFGLAKVNSTDKNHTITRFQAGTINYMSPEQVRGLHHVDYRSDIYSLGKAFYEILAGRLPFDASDSDQFDIWKMIVEAQFKPPSHFKKSIPGDIDILIMKALEKDREDRYQSAREMIEAIDVITKKKSAPEKRRNVSANTNKTHINTKKAPTIQKRTFQKRKVWPLLSIGFILLTAFGLYASGIFSKIQRPVRQTSILITSNPPDALVYINNVNRGATPSDSIMVEEGEMVLRLEKNSYETLDTTILITAGTVTPVHLEMRQSIQEAPVTAASFTIESVPPGAQIRLNGDILGVTPFSSTFPSGKHSVELQLDGYEKHALGVELTAGDNAPINVDLEALGTIYITSNQAEAVVSVDGQRLGQTPLSHPLTAGRYRINVEADGFNTFSETITVRPERQSTINAELSAISRTLRVRVNPFGAIYIDGRLVSDEEQGWFETSLPAGRHRLRAVHPGFGEWEKEINLAQSVEEIRINFLEEKVVNITSGRISGAVIFVDGESKERETPGQVNIRVGKRRIEVRKEGYTTTPPFMDVLIEEDQPEPLRFTFSLDS